jgi:hypothetical protein
LGFGVIGIGSILEPADPPMGFFALLSVAEFAGFVIGLRSLFAV